METTTNTKYAVQRNVMKTAHTIAKTLDTAVKYTKRLGKAIKMAWSKIKALLTTVLSVAYPLLDAYSRGKEKMTEAKKAIENGGKFNGVIYAKMVNKNNSLISVYVSNVCFSFQAQKEDIEQIKKEILSFLSDKKEATSTTGTAWLVNGKEVRNNLTYAKMWDMYGSDFE